MNMIKFFIPKEARCEILNRVEQYKYDNEYNKAVFNLDSSNLDKEKQLFHNIMKLKHSVTGQVYSYNFDDNCEKLISYLQFNKNNVYDIDASVLDIFMNALDEAYNDKNNWFLFDHEMRDSVAMSTNYRIQLESIKCIKEVSDTDNINVINNEFNEFIAQFKPLNKFLELIKSVNVENLIIDISIADIQFRNNVTNINVTEDKIVFYFTGGQYCFNINESIYPCDDKDYLDGCEWSYELNGYVRIGYRKVD